MTRAELAVALTIDAAQPATGLATIRVLANAGYVVVPKEPTERMLIAARDWSRKKYGESIGRDDSEGCYRAMIAASQEDAE